MNSSQTKWWVGLALALLAVTMLLEFRGPSSAAPDPEASSLVPQLRPSTVTRVELTRSNATLRAERTDAHWRLTAPVSYPGYDFAINALLDACSKLRPRLLITGPEARKLADFGLQPPQATVLFRQGGQPVELRIGARTPVNNQLYVQVAGSDHIAVTDANLLELLPANPDIWRDRNLLSLTGVKFDRLRVRQGTRDLLLQREATNQVWRVEEPKPVKRANNPRIEQLVQDLQKWPVARFVTDNARAELEPFGLNAPETELTFAAGTNDLLVVQFGKSPTKQPDFVFARNLATTNVMLVPRPLLELLRSPVWEFCEHRLVDVLPADAVDTIQVRGPEPFTLRRQIDGTNLVWISEDKFASRAEPAQMQMFLANLLALEAVELEKDVVTDYAPFNLATPERSLSLLRSGTNSVGAPTNTLVARLDFGKLKAIDAVFARRHDEGSVYVVPRGDVERLAWSFFQVQERSVWSFATNEVAALTVAWDGQNRRLTRAADGRWSEGTEPLDLLRNLALEETMFRLGQLRAQRWVFLADVEDKRLPAYGIGADSRRVAIELAGPTARTNVVTFGYLPTGRNPWAAVADPRTGRPLVLEFPRELFLHYVVQYLGATK